MSLRSSREQQLTKAIMRRVRLIYMFRLLTSPLALEAAMFAVLLTVINLSISLADIYFNVSHLSYMSESIGYLASALWHAKFSVQVILCSTCILVLFMAREIYRNIRNIKSRPDMSGFLVR